MSNIFVLLKYLRFNLLPGLYHSKEKFSHFLRFKASITHISIDFTTLESLLS